MYRQVKHPDLLFGAQRLTRGLPRTVSACCVRAEGAIWAETAFSDAIVIDTFILRYRNELHALQGPKVADFGGRRISFVRRSLSPKFRNVVSYPSATTRLRQLAKDQ